MSIRDPNRVYQIYYCRREKPFQSQCEFSSNMVFEPQKDHADYALIMTRAGFKPAPEEESKVIHRVEREGAPLSFILKMK